MIWEELKSRKNFVEEDFIELRDSVEELISVIEKYKDMRKDSDEYITELKEFLEEVNLTLEEKKITDRELKNLNSLRESYFNSHINSISEYAVYDKNDLEKTHKVNEEITVAVSRFGKILLNHLYMYLSYISCLCIFQLHLLVLLLSP